VAKPSSAFTINSVLTPAAPLLSMTLLSSQVLEGGAVWLRYQVQNG
jgi:hypothetical protein